MSYINKTAKIQNIEWPARSPDLNIIENVWSMLSDIVYDGPQPRNLKELEQRIIDGVSTINNENSEKIKKIIQLNARSCTRCH